MKIILFTVVLIHFILSENASALLAWNQASTFSGTASSYISVPHSSSLNITGNFTIEAWVNPVNVSSPSAQIILQKRAGSNSSGYTLYLSSGKVAIRTNSSTRLIGKTAIPSNQWTHIAGSFVSSTNTFRVFVNGAEDTSVVIISAAPVSNTDSVLIGVGSNNPFAGKMDEVRIWNVGMTGASVSLIYRTSLGVSTGFYGGLVMSLYFQNANASGSMFDLNDQSGNNNNGFNRGVSQFSMYDNPSTTISLNECINLDGTGDYLSGADHPSVSPVNGITIEGWVYPRSFDPGSTVYSTIVHKGNASGSVTDYRFEISRQRFRIFVNETNILGLNTSGDFFPLNRWTHFAFTYSGSSGFITSILNGKIRWDDTNFVGNIHDNTDSIYVGGTTSLENFDGYIDELRITSSELNYGDIAEQVFSSMNELNDRISTNVSYNFDGNTISNSDAGPRLALRGNAQFSYNSTGNNIPVSPVSYSIVTDFGEGYYLSSAGGRIPVTGTSGFMTSDTIDVMLEETITDVNVFVALNHTDEDNLVLSLISPSGTSVTLFSTSSLVSNGDNVVSIFDDQADSSLASNKFVMFSPTIKPLNNLNSVLNGLSTKGKWKLRIQDVISSDTGRLYGWGIQFNNHPLRKAVLSLTSLFQGFYNPSTNLMISDTVKVTVRMGVTPYNILGTAAGKLNDSGKADLVFSDIPDGVPVYLVLNHRNSIETWGVKSTTGTFSLLFSNYFDPFTSFLNYNFSSSLINTFGLNQINVDSSPTKYAMYGGDVNQDDVIDGTDGTLIDNDAAAFNTGYINTDLNGDEVIDGSDAVIADNNAANFVTAVTP